MVPSRVFWHPHVPSLGDARKDSKWLLRKDLRSCQRRFANSRPRQHIRREQRHGREEGWKEAVMCIPFRRPRLKITYISYRLSRLSYVPGGKSTPYLKFFRHDSGECGEGTHVAGVYEFG